MTIDNQLLDGIVRDAAVSPELRACFCIPASEEADSCSRISVLLPGAPLPVHRYRESTVTYVLLRGRIFVVFYNEVGAVTGRHLLEPASGLYGILIPKGQWHTVEVVEPSAVFEVKEGPFRPLEPEDIMY